MIERIDKLPRWDRNRILKLEMDVKYYRDRSLQVTSPEGTSVQVCTYFDDVP